MKTPLQQRLSGGDRKSVGDAREIADEVLEQPILLVEVMDGIESDDPILRSRCAHVLAAISAVQAELLYPFKAEILDSLSLIDQWEVREQMSKVIPRLVLDKTDLEKANQIFEMYLTDRSSIVRTCALQGQFDLLSLDRSRANELRSKLEETKLTGTAAMRARSRILLAEMDKGRKL